MYISKKYINLFHILFVAPLFYYLASKRGDVDPKVYDMLYGLAIGIAVYHLYKLMDLKKQNAPV